MIHIRKAEWFDSESVMELRMAYHHEESLRDPRFRITEPRMIALMALRTMEMLMDPSKTVLVAVADGVIVGYLMVDQADFVGFHAISGVSVVGLYLKPEFRGGMAGYKLVRTAKQIAIKSGYPRSQAVVLSKNQTMHDMMRSFGYEPIAVVYQKDLAHGKSDLGSEDGKQVHEERCGDTSGCAGGSEPESSLPSGSAACTGIPAKSEHVFS